MTNDDENNSHEPVAAAAAEPDVAQATSVPLTPQQKAARRRAIERHECAGLERSDATLACLTFVESDLLSVASDIGDVLRQKLSEPATPEVLQHLEPTLASYARVTKELERFLKFKANLERAEKRHADLKADVLRMALKPPGW
jgi:hypothetical protein